MEAFVIIFLLLIVILYFRRFSNFVYAFSITDILLRILYFIRINLKIPEISNFIAKYFPKDIPSIINKYTNGTLAEILVWGYVIVFIVFEFYLIRAFIRNKKL